MKISISNLFLNIRTHFQEEHIRSLQQNRILEAAYFRGFSPNPAEPIDHILSETKIGTIIFSALNKDWIKTVQDPIQFIVGNVEGNQVTDQMPSWNSKDFLKKYGLIGLPEGIVAHLSLLLQQHNYTNGATIARIGSVACGLPAKCVRLPVQIGLEIFDISIRLALGLSVALCVKFSLYRLHNSNTRPQTYDTATQNSTVHPEWHQILGQHNNENAESSELDLPIARIRKPCQICLSTPKQWAIKSYKKAKWHLQWFIWRNLNPAFFYQVEGFKSQTHRMPPRSWFHHFTSEDPNQRAAAYWGIRDAHVGSLIMFSVYVENILSDPEKAYRSIQLRYILGYLFGDIEYDQMIDEAVDQIEFLSSKTLYKQYISPILHNPTAYCADPHQFRSESKYIEGAVEFVRDLYESLLRCLRSKEVLATLDLIPRHYYQESLSGERKIITLNFDYEGKEEDDRLIRTFSTHQRRSKYNSNVSIL